jgi:hypothetical protein
VVVDDGSPVGVKRASSEASNGDAVEPFADA